MKSKQTNQSKPLIYHLGNLFIVLPLLFLFYIYYPIAKVYFFPSTARIHYSADTYYVKVPKIQAISPIIPNVDPWNKTEYLQALKKGVAQAKGTALPGEKGTVYLFAHSSDYPWNITLYNTAFFRLGELQANDEVLVIKNDATYHYKVVGKKEIWPQEVEYIKPNSKNQLILQTCTPIGTDLKRLLIFAVSS